VYWDRFTFALSWISGSFIYFLCKHLLSPNKIKIVTINLTNLQFESEKAKKKTTCVNKMQKIVQ